MDESSKTKKLTVSLIIRWIFGLLFALSFLGALTQGSILGALLMLIATIITLPPTSLAIEKAMNFSLSGALRFVVVFVLLVGAGIVMPNADTPATDTNDISAAPSADASTGQTPVTEKKEPTEISTPIIEETPQSEEEYQEALAKQKAEEASSSEEPEKEIVSTSFSDFALYSDSTATSLQKESFFDDNYKGKYVTWSGTVSSVSESYGSYAVQVKHKSSTLVSDVHCRNER